MKRTLKSLAGLALALVVFATGHAYAATLTLDPPTGAVYGSVGQSIGWGFTLTNDSDQWLAVTSTDFQTTSSTLGSYTDYAGPQLLVLDPHASLTQSFDAATSRGIGSYVLAATAHAGDVATGRMLLTYDLYADVDLLNQTGFSNIVTADASVHATPIPGAVMLLGSGLTALAGLRRRAS
jgi:hypothetical protein